MRHVHKHAREGVDGGDLPETGRFEPRHPVLLAGLWTEQSRLAIFRVTGKVLERNLSVVVYFGSVDGANTGGRYIWAWLGLGLFDKNVEETSEETAEEAHAIGKFLWKERWKYVQVTCFAWGERY